MVFSGSQRPLEYLIEWCVWGWNIQYACNGNYLGVPLTKTGDHNDLRKLHSFRYDNCLSEHKRLEYSICLQWQLFGCHSDENRKNTHKRSYRACFLKKMGGKSGFLMRKTAFWGVRVKAIYWRDVKIFRFFRTVFWGFSVRFGGVLGVSGINLSSVRACLFIASRLGAERVSWGRVNVWKIIPNECWRLQ